MPNSTQRSEQLQQLLRLFGANVKKLRKAKKLTQEELAEASGMHTNYLGGVERGERNVTLSNADRIARALDVPITDLLTDLPPADAA